jgi:hypothetical protein
MAALLGRIHGYTERLFFVALLRASGSDYL